MAVGEGIEEHALLARRVRQVSKAETGPFNNVNSVNSVTSIAGVNSPGRASSIAVADTRTEGRLLNRILLVAFVLGGSVDVLFYKKATGISTLVFVGLIIGALATLGIMERVKVAWRNV